MAKTTIKVNHDNEELFCAYSKERIEIGEKYVVLEEEDCTGTVIVKEFKMEYAPSEDDLDEEPWICEDEGKAWPRR